MNRRTHITFNVEVNAEDVTICGFSHRITDKFLPFGKMSKEHNTL